MKPPPRRAHPRDAGWLLFAAVTVVAYGYGLWATVAATPPSARAGALLWSMLWGIPAYLLVMGAWRRTAWGSVRTRLWWLPGDDGEGS